MRFLGDSSGRCRGLRSGLNGSSGRREGHSRRDGEKGIADREEDVWDVEECVKKDGGELSC